MGGAAGSAMGARPAPSSAVPGPGRPAPAPVQNNKKKK
jgi:hypothetical protein